jgi:hypothetical protein
MTPFSTREPDWSHWRTKSDAPLWCAVCLACNIDPEQFIVKGQRLPSPLGLYSTPAAVLLDLARSCIATGGLLRPIEVNGIDIDSSKVSLANFVTWLDSIKHPLPAEFPWVPEAPDFTNLVWPWGRHSTGALRKLAEVANKLWKDYDPDDPSSAPTNRQVIEWLTGQGVAKRTAEVMATILRPEDLPMGPRK